MHIYISSYIFAAAQSVDIKALPHVSADANEIQKILSVVLTITGGIALLIITIAGLRYIIAQGDPQAISQAKNTILYALVGLIVSASALVIVTFTLGSL